MKSLVVINGFWWILPDWLMIHHHSNYCPINYDTWYSWLEKLTVLMIFLPDKMVIFHGNLLRGYRNPSAGAAGGCHGISITRIRHPPRVQQVTLRHVPSSSWGFWKMCQWSYYKSTNQSTKQKNDIGGQHDTNYKPPLNCKDDFSEFKGSSSPKKGDSIWSNQKSPWFFRIHRGLYYYSSVIIIILLFILLSMAEILHHLGCKKLSNNGKNYQPQLVSRISAINSTKPWHKDPFIKQPGGSNGGIENTLELRLKAAPCFLIYEFTPQPQTIHVL